MGGQQRAWVLELLNFAQRPLGAITPADVDGGLPQPGCATREHSPRPDDPHRPRLLHLPVDPPHTRVDHARCVPRHAGRVMVIEAPPVYCSKYTADVDWGLEVADNDRGPLLPGHYQFSGVQAQPSQ